MNIAIDVKEAEQHIHINVGGEIDAYTAPELKGILMPKAEQTGVHMIVDLSNVTYMDSTGLGVFVGVFKTVKAQKGELRLTGLSARLSRLFTITGLADIMNLDRQTEGEPQ
ncbi:anti-sigma factor antagonist [Bacillus fonticola]|uniref:anti-sigma factor antagonist n=1 Tax=Bacillus fonticola TaxID=2728853 RepID=UPI001472C4B3|nr:anti-sigma factor antagonist [Bacillus fonticola]